MGLWDFFKAKAENSRCMNENELYMKRIDVAVDKHADKMKLVYRQTVYNDSFGVPDTTAFMRAIAPIISCEVPGIPQRIREVMLEYATGVVEGLVFDEDCGTGEDAREELPMPEPGDGIGFEYYCADKFRAAGFMVEQTPATGDQGADLIVLMHNGNTKVVIQCKNYSKPVGNSAVQEVVAARSHFGGHAALVLSRSGYTPAARQLAQTNNVILADPREDINDILGQLLLVL